jgi:hypothetical protein
MKMTVKIKQEWGNVVATLVNDYWELPEGNFFGCNVRENGVNVGTLWSVFGRVPLHGSKTVTVVPPSPKPRVGSKVDVTIIQDAGHEKLVRDVFDYSNEIAYRARVVPTWAWAVGIGAVGVALVGVVCLAKRK